MSADVYAFGAPSVSKVAPAAGPTAGGNTVTVSGSGFVPGSAVKFGSVTLAASSVSFVSGTELKVVVPAESAGTVAVTVRKPAGKSAAVSADVYAFGAPSVSKVAPEAGPTAGGNTVTVSGSGFVPGSMVKFGSVTLAAGSVSFVSGSEFKVMVPAESAGTVDVRVMESRWVQPGCVGGSVCVWCAVGDQGQSCRGSHGGREHGHGLRVWVCVWFDGEVRFGGGVIGELCLGD